MYKESSSGNYSTNNYLKVCDLQSAFNSSDSPTLMLTYSHTHTYLTMQPTVQEMHFYKLMPRHQIYTAVQIWVFIKSHYSQIAYWILNIVFTLRLIEAFCFQTVSCNIFKQKKCSAIHCLQPESVISTTAEIESMPSMQTQFISNLLSLSLLERPKMLAYESF